MADAAADRPTATPATGETERDGTLISFHEPVAALRREAAVLPAFPGYEVLGVLGRGGMGIVYLARQERPCRLVAIKTVFGADRDDPAVIERFRRESEVLARLRNPNIVPVYEVGEHQGRAYFSMEYLEGGGLDRRLAGTPQPARVAATVAGVLARAVHTAHLAGVIHRDLKPANVLVVEPAAESNPVPLDRCTLKLTDFGLAKQTAAGPAGTRTGMLLGTPGYMAPEQATGKGAATSPAADIYSLGAILYELLTGRPPFRAACAWDTVEQVTRDDPVAPSRLQPGLPRDLETVCLKCLAKEPDRRYATADDLAADLCRFLDGKPVLARPTGRAAVLWKWVKRKPAAAASILLAAVAVASVMVGLVLFARQEKAHAAALARERDRAIAANETIIQWIEASSLGRPLGRQDEERIDQAVRFFADRAGRNPDDPEARYRLAMALHFRGKFVHGRVEQTGEPLPVEAEEAYRRAVPLFEAAHDDPDPGRRVVARLVLGNTCNNLGLAAAGRAAWGDSRHWFDRAVDELTRLTRDYPDRPEFEIFRANAIGNRARAETLRLKAEWDAAAPREPERARAVAPIRQQLREALDIYKAAFHRSPPLRAQDQGLGRQSKDYDAAVQLAELAGDPAEARRVIDEWMTECGEDVGSRYRACVALARLYGRWERPDDAGAALRCLEVFAELGVFYHRDNRDLLGRPELGPLRELPRFQALLARVTPG